MCCLSLSLVGALVRFRIVVMESVEDTTSAATRHAVCCRQCFVASFPLFVSVFVYMYYLMLFPFRVVILDCAPLICCTVLLFAPAQDDCRSPRCASSAAVGCADGDIPVGSDAGTVLRHADMMHVMMEVFIGDLRIRLLSLLSAAACVLLMMYHVTAAICMLI